MGHQTRVRGLAAVFGGLLVLGPTAALEAQAPDEPTMTVPVAPVRILDTRTGIGTGGLTVPVGPNGVIELAVAGVESVPANAVGVVLNITAAEGTEASYLTVYPSGTARPTASVLNVAPGSNLPNMITAKLGADGKLRIYNYAGSVHVVADVAGYLIPGGQGGGTGPQGSQGPAGPPGAAGPPGTATAWGTVSGFGTPSFVAKAPNVASVTRLPGTPAGGYCITFGSPLPFERRMAAVMSNVSGNLEFINRTRYFEDQCPGAIVVEAYLRGEPLELGDTEFSFIVP
jgi:hypothetical protein